ncbi:serine hydrolase domain-containing protein [Trichoderma aethiopicum]
MRFLCLHGRGTSAQIFELQTARLREQLSDHEFVFIDGVVETEPSEGAEAVADEFFGWFDQPVTPAHTRQVLQGLIDFITANGPFHGLMGFSEGGIVAATLLAHDARERFAGLECGILMSAAPPLDPAGILEGQGDPPTLRCLTPAVDGTAIRVPTAHVVGANEPFAHLVSLSPLAGVLIGGGLEDPEELHQLLFHLCDGSRRERFVHPLGHEVPGARSDEGLAGTVRVIERTIERAQSE